jgi:hypothetical protein
MPIVFIKPKARLTKGRPLFADRVTLIRRRAAVDGASSMSILCKPLCQSSANVWSRCNSAANANSATKREATL